LWCRQEKGAARSGSTRKPFDAPAAQKNAALKGWVPAGARIVAALADRTAIGFGPRRADRTRRNPNAGGLIPLNQALHKKKGGCPGPT